MNKDELKKELREIPIKDLLELIYELMIELMYVVTNKISQKYEKEILK